MSKLVETRTGSKSHSNDFQSKSTASRSRPGPRRSFVNARAKILVTECPLSQCRSSTWLAHRSQELPGGGYQGICQPKPYDHALSSTVDFAHQGDLLISHLVLKLIDAELVNLEYMFKKRDSLDGVRQPPSLGFYQCPCHCE